jgi:hypothetical protein
MRKAIEEAFWNFINQKWRDALNVAAAEPPSWGAGGGRSAPQEGGKKGGEAEAAKLAKAAVHVTGADGRRPRQGDSGRSCVFKDVMECQGTHPPWHCKVFGKLPAKEREKIIKDNRLCPFCLLHDKDKSWHVPWVIAREGTSRRCTTFSKTCSGRRARSMWCTEAMTGKSRRKHGSWARRK